MTTPPPATGAEVAGSALVGTDLDGPAHRGDPLAEQRAMARAAAVVDRGRREVIAVSGPDRLSWLHLLLTQHVSELGPNAGTESLVLDANGRVLHHMLVAHAPSSDPAVADTVYLDTEPGGAAPLLDYLRKMVFWSKVEPRDATAELAVLSVVGPETDGGAGRRRGAHAGRPDGVRALPGRRVVRPDERPGRDVVDLLVPRAAQGDWWDRLRAAGARPAGRWPSRRCGWSPAVPGGRGHRRPDDPARGGLDRLGRAPDEGLLPRPGDGGPGREPRAGPAPAGAAAPRRRRRAAAR